MGNDLKTLHPADMGAGLRSPIHMDLHVINPSPCHNLGFHSGHPLSRIPNSLKDRDRGADRSTRHVVLSGRRHSTDIQGNHTYTNTFPISRNHNCNRSTNSSATGWYQENRALCCHLNRLYKKEDYMSDNTSDILKERDKSK